jgi:hypothetical protein
MFNNLQFREVILHPVLKAFQFHFADYEELLIGTLAQESAGGTYVRQLKGGPGLGPFSMEPRTHDDIWNVVMPHNPILTHNLMSHCMLGINRPKAELMIYHISYATAMAAIQYFRHKDYKPKTLEEMASYWKKYYNSKDGQGTEEEFIDNYLKFVGAKNEKIKTNGKKEG